MANQISTSFKCVAMLDDDYILYDDGTVVHNYDKHIYPGGYNLTETLTINQLGVEVKNRLIDDAPSENREIVKIMLNVI